MLVSQCPRCDEPVRVPHVMLAAGRSDVHAKCPLCLATIDAQELSRRLPPALILLGDAVADDGTNGDPADASLDASSFDTVIDPAGNVAPTVSIGAVADASLEFEPLAFSDDSAATNDLGDHNVGASGQDPSSIVMMDVDSTRRRSRRKRRSPVKQVLGMIAGLPLALLFVGGSFWLFGKPLPNLGFPPFDGRATRPSPSVQAAQAMEIKNSGSSSKSIPQGRSLAEDLPPPDAEQDPATEVADALREAADPSWVDDPASVTFDPDAKYEGIVDLEAGDPNPKSDVSATPDASVLGMESVALNTIDAIRDPEAVEVEQATNQDPPESPVTVTATEPAGQPSIDELPELPNAVRSSVDTQDVFRNADIDVSLMQAKESIQLLTQIDPDDARFEAKFRDVYGELASAASQMKFGEPLSATQERLLDGILDRLVTDKNLLMAFASKVPELLSRASTEIGAGTVVVGKVSESGDSLILGNRQSYRLQRPPGVSSTSGIQIGVCRIADDQTLQVIRIQSVQ
ncbi:MAG: hypothetical protein AAF670_03460 [Planctomycetota bacterium]